MYIYVNQQWSTDMAVISQDCSTVLETLTIKCRLFYPPQDFVILVAVYIPLQAAASEVAHIMEMENSYPDSSVLLLWDFNHVNLKKTLPSFKQQIHVPTRYDKVLNQHYRTIANAFHAIAWAPLGQSDHNVILLIPVYCQKLKAVKPRTKVVKQWSNGNG